MIRTDSIWLALGASDLRHGFDKLLAHVVYGFALDAQARSQQRARPSDRSPQAKSATDCEPRSLLNRDCTNFY